MRFLPNAAAALSLGCWLIGPLAGCCDCPDDDAPADDDDATDDDDSGDIEPEPPLLFGAEPDFVIPTGGAGPCAITVAQVDGDDVLDLVVSHIYSGSLSVFFGQADGDFLGAWHEFGQLAPAAVGVELGVIAAGRFDGDEFIDFAVASGGTDEVVVVTNPGLALATEPFGVTAYPVGEFPFGVAAADFDDDGRDDLAVSGGVSNDVTVLLQTAPGVFETVGSFDVGGLEPGFISIADIDGDGRPDLITTNHSSSSVSLLLGLGGGCSQTPSPSRWAMDRRRPSSPTSTGTDTSTS
jgi:hypothetical protein